MPKGEHTYYLMKSKPKNHDWRCVSQWMYDKIDLLADTLEEVIVKIKAHKVH